MPALTAFKSILLGLNAAQIKTIAQACGSAVNGTKATLAQTLYETTVSRVSSPNSPFRLVSLDLGIKNIGFACITAPPLTDPSPNSKPIVEQWYRTSLPDVPSVTYPHFSDVVLDFTRSLLQSIPNVQGVVLEKQRARTNGSPNIPKDVLRVNIFEGMLFTALRLQNPSLFLQSVSPRDVLSFWKFNSVNQASKSKPTAAYNYRVAKKARQELVDKWIADEALSPVNFQNLDSNLLTSHKKDDAYDALVQAFTWLNWRQNGYRLLQNIEKEQSITQGLETPNGTLTTLRN